MALKPTIYKLKISLVDTDRDYYDTLSLTVAQHPSETRERMMARVLAFCINAQDSLVFTEGLCVPEEPDIRACTLDGRISMWIDVGEPGVERMRKASRVSGAVRIYSFHSKSDTWWEQGQAQFGETKVSIFQFPWESIQVLAMLVKRTMNLSVTISGDTAYVAADNGECSVSWLPLQIVAT